MYFKIALVLILMLATSHGAAKLEQSDTISLRYSLTTFTKKIWKGLYDEISTRNLVFSPLLIQIYLTMYALGATSTTRTELFMGLAYRNTTFFKTAEFFKQLFLNLPTSLHARADVTTLSKVMGQPLNEDFAKILESFEAVFERSKYFDVDKANKFVEIFTNNKVSKFLRYDPSKHTSFLALINALRMTGHWSHVFDESRTNMCIFYRNGDDDVYVDMMQMRGNFLYANMLSLESIAIVLPLINEKIRLMILLPNERDGLPQLIEKVLSNKHSFYDLDLQMTEVDLSLPKFAIYQNVNINPDVIEKLGLMEPFSDDAKFGGLFYEEIFGKLNDVLQRVVFEIDETTMNISSGTFINIIKRPIRSTNVEVIVDHPFMFIFYVDSITFYAGHVNDVPIF